MEGIFFYAGFAMMLALKRQNKMVGIGEQFEYIMRDESLHLAFGCDLINTIRTENPEIWTTEFQDEIVQLIMEAVELEKQYAIDACPQGLLGINAESFCDYVEYIADRRLKRIELPEQYGMQNPFPWMSQATDLSKEKNFFETRVTEYQTGASSAGTSSKAVRREIYSPPGMPFSSGWGARMSAARLNPAALLAAASLILAIPASLFADSRLADYEELARRAYSQPIQVPPGGLDIRLDVAHLRLEEGTIRLQSPLSDGLSHGLVFEGRGRLVVEVPDPIELRQLRRFTKQPDLDRLDQELTEAVITTSDPTLFGSLVANEPYEQLRVAKERHEFWSREEWLDADLQLIEAQSDAESPFTRVDVRTKAWGWLCLSFQGRKREELTLTRYNTAHRSIEHWLSIDRQEDRRANGRPSYDYSAAFEIPHVDVKLDVSRRAKQSPIGFSEIQPLLADLQSEVRVVSRTDALGALRLSLTPWAGVTSVKDANGGSLPFLRDHFGRYSSSLDNDLHDDSLLVLLPEALDDGEEMTLFIHYEMIIHGYAPGRSWYPGPAGPIPARLSPHTSSFEISHRENQAARASGTLDWEGDNRMLWEQERPVKMASFAAVSKPHEATHKLEGAPTVKTFASLGGAMTVERVDQVGTDVASAVHYFQQLFEDPLEISELRTALIPSFHGQAFDGFLHVGDFTVMLDSIAATAMFRAHEVAHQWWGHRVLWASYRDQWLSEAFAEYSAMLFVKDAFESGDKEFKQILAAYSDEVKGSLKSVFSSYARPDYTPLTRIGLERIGPIGHGYRCAVGEAPSSYFTQTYLKGALVLHMLHQLVAVMTKDPAMFIEVLRTFVDRHAGGIASTEDFIAVLQEKVPADWSWFFDQWVYGAEIPTYEWSYEIVKGQSQPFALELHVEQENVSPGFKMAVPVQIVFSKGRVGTAIAFVNAASKDFSFPLPERPKKVVFNPDNAVLARTKKR